METQTIKESWYIHEAVARTLPLIEAGAAPAPLVVQVCQAMRREEWEHGRCVPNNAEGRVLGYLRKYYNVK